MNIPNTCPKCGTTLPADAPEGLCPACLMRGGFSTGAGTVKMTPSHKPGAPEPTTPTPEELAPLFPQLEIIELLGRGGMGAVYKARQKTLNRIVALKILPVEAGADEHFAERFQREAQALARLNHPNIVTVYEVGSVEAPPSSLQDGASGAPAASDTLFYFLMEFVDGANLRTLIRGGKMKPEAALALIPAFCDALQYAHDEGVVHRDIKPENVLVDKKGCVKIADFGLAKLLGHETTDHALTRTGMTLGTPRYMAPEQIDKPETVDHRADIYSLGVVFYEMLTGELPMGRFAPPSQMVQVDVRFDEIVLHALERDVKLRYQHASEIKTDVEGVTSKPVAGAAPAVTPPPSPAQAVPVNHLNNFLGFFMTPQPESPTTSTKINAMDSSTTGKYLAIIGACMQAGPLVGLIWTVIGMKRAFDSFGNTGIGDPAQLSNSIGAVLLTPIIGAIVGIVGTVLIFVSLLGCRYRAEWFFWFLYIYGVISLFAFPVGTVIGIVFLVYCITHRTQFFAAKAQSQPPSISP